MACTVPSQQLSNGFCYERCPNGWEPSGSACLSKCPEGFTDHGTTCEPPSLLRNPIKAYVEACPANQIELGGNCFEPQTVSYVVINGVQVPKVSGCGCIRRTLGDRIQCPNGYVKYNNSCLPPCPTGYVDIKDAEGAITSMYCMAQCPLNYGSKNERWNFLGGQCVKEFRSRLPQRPTATTSATLTQPSFRILRGVFGVPQSVLASLANKPLGSSLTNRYRAGQSIYTGVNTNTNSFRDFLPTSWTALLENPEALVIFAIIIVALIYAGPALFSAIGGFFKFLLPAIGSATGSVVKGAGAIAGSVEQLGATTIGAVSAVEQSAAQGVVGASNVALGQSALTREELEQAAAGLSAGLTPEMLVQARTMLSAGF